ncbi:uncharacterized protein LOC122253498 [Penaeus japonicus]|uniref:uncharacterized protein LOC122253498 n=1 Tax=Penaeus japonicus TaxID=27405 RepID=UPI001C70F98D|nr:uncharacterized protein LOC122253498 [Penaeus japonicus]
METRSATRLLLVLALQLCWVAAPVSSLPDVSISSAEGTSPYYRAPQGNFTSKSCVNGRLIDARTCLCNPCWEGESCTKYVDLYAPRFLVHAATAVLPINASGVVYRAWSTDEDLGLTCPLGPGEPARCPCAAVTYQLFSSPGDRHFVLDSATGVLSRPAPPPASSSPAAKSYAPLRTGRTYTYKLMVQGLPHDDQSEELLYDLLDLKIYVSSDYARKVPWT